MFLTRLYNEFFNSEKSGGLILLIVTAFSLVAANLSWQESYISIWNSEFGGHNLNHWINDGLMTIFFLLIGLELEREIYHGELSRLNKATLPVFAALGGMLVPAGIFLLVTSGSTFQSGAGIPMATDIAFAIAILSLLGKRVPFSLKIFLTALAVIDDLGAIFVIAIFYTKTISLPNLMIAMAIYAILIVFNRVKVCNLIPYLAGGVAMWYFMHLSGVHATITGVLLAFAIPFSDGGEKSPSFLLQHLLHKPVAFIILPLFAAANTCIPLGESWVTGLGQPNSIGIMAGLLIGKPFGIWIFSLMGAWLGISVLPPDLKWKHIFGVGLMGGIGFTMSIFITLLAYSDTETINISKIAIILASIIAGTAGFLWLRTAFQPDRTKKKTMK